MLYIVVVTCCCRFGQLIATLWAESCRELQTWIVTWRHALPLVQAALLVALSLYISIWIWNTIFLALTLTSIIFASSKHLLGQLRLSTDLCHGHQLLSWFWAPSSLQHHIHRHWPPLTCTMHIVFMHKKMLLWRLLMLYSHPVLCKLVLFALPPHHIIKNNQHLNQWHSRSTFNIHWVGIRCHIIRHQLTTWHIQ